MKIIDTAEWRAPSLPAPCIESPPPRKFKRRAFDIVFPRDDPWSCRERACLSDLRNFAHWIAIVSISLRIVSSGTNREEIMIMKRDRIDSRREWDERERERLTNRWRGKLDYTSPLREKDVSRFVDVSHFVLKRHDRHILENTCCYAGYEVTIAGTPSSWDRFYCTPTRETRDSIGIT